MSQYNYTKTPVAIDRLEKEIRDSSIIVALNYISVLGDQVSIFFKAAISVAEQTTLSSIVTAHTGVPLPDNYVQKITFEADKMTSKGIQKVSMYEPEGTGATIVSHNYADKCSWFTGSVQVIAGTFTTSNNLTFTSQNAFWIDMVNGRTYDEDTYNVAGMYNPVIKIGGVVQTTGFTINYPAGTVTFSSAVTGVVTADYYRADKSFFRLKPASGKILSIKAAEIQFSSNVAFTKPFVFEVWFSSHPTYGTNPVPGTRIAYKNAKDFISACNEGQGLIPKWNELTFDVHVFPFNYARPKPIKFSQYLEIRVYTVDDTPVTGEFGTATFYVTIDSEV